MKVRLADIATQVGVSVATVSRVLNGKPGISDATRRAVLDALEERGYETPPDRHRVGRAGLVVPDLENPIFPSFVRHAEGTLAAHGFAPLLCAATPIIDEREYIDMLVDCGVAGIIFIAGRHANTETDHSRYHELKAAGIALSFVNGYFPGIDAPFVASDDTQALRLAFQHLYDLGHRRIGCAIGPSRYISTRRKVAGFLLGYQETAALGSVPDKKALERLEAEMVAYSVYSVEGGQAAAEQLLHRGVTAIVCGSDQMALGVIRTATANGLRVPHDVSVIGYDDFPIAPFLAPPLTTMRQNVAAMSVIAVNSMMDELRHSRTETREVLVAAELVIRGSTGPVPGSEPGRVVD
ncbi:LacI family DNA-binding transcriptional regulator [Acidothermaceae bacterium B102]|nr:LacI family DNA-binding transcriptional regulator [Acidothermaceae bacterium B102]